MTNEAVSREAARAVALLAKVLDLTLAELDLSASQYRLLVYLREKPAAATALAQLLDVSRPSLTALVDGLVARGFVVREPDAHDRRRVTHQISDAGLAAAALADTAVQERLAELLGHLERPDAEDAARGLELCLTAILASRAAKAGT